MKLVTYVQAGAPHLAEGRAASSRATQASRYSIWRRWARGRRAMGSRCPM